MPASTYYFASQAAQRNGANLLSQILITASATILFVLGTMHLVYTFASSMFHPRDAQLELTLKQVSPVISKQTTMWKAWIGFNASHSLGIMLFGATYGYLAVFQLALLQQSIFLITLGGLFLIGLLILAKRYWFKIPLLGVAVSLILYIGGAIIALL